MVMAIGTIHIHKHYHVGSANEDNAVDNNAGGAQVQPNQAQPNNVQPGTT